MRSFWCVVVCGVFVAGVAVGVAGAKAKGFPPTIYQGKEAKAAGLALLEVAQQQAGNGSWELIGVGRVYYLSGGQAKGQALFDRGFLRANGTRATWSAWPRSTSKRGSGPRQSPS